MFNNLKYRVSGVELKNRVKNEPRSMYLIISLSPIEMDEFGIANNFDIHLNLASIKKLIDLDKDTKERIDRLLNMKTTFFEQWKEDSRKINTYVRDKIYNQNLILSF